ncbi:IS66 family insertion sequence element accessory protein TnpB [bacterium]|nr:IS66 family insertion sequence element accessory protein TnpB [bacterium]
MTPHMRIMAAVEPVDFRKGIYGLCAVCRQRLQSDPFTGTVFVFINKSRTALRILAYDGQGYWLCHKRLSQGRFNWGFKGKVSLLAARELQALMWNVFPIRNPGEFRSIEKNIVNLKKSAGQQLKVSAIGSATQGGDGVADLRQRH